MLEGVVVRVFGGMILITPGSYGLGIVVGVGSKEFRFPGASATRRGVGTRRIGYLVLLFRIGLGCGCTRIRIFRVFSYVQGLYAREGCRLREIGLHRLDLRFYCVFWVLYIRNFWNLVFSVCVGSRLRGVCGGVRARGFTILVL